MNSGFQQKVLAATYTCIRPFARMLLRSGINYQQFAEIAKNAFVDEAAKSHNEEGKISNVSRVAIKTGLSRKEVARIRDRREERLLGEKDLVSEILHAGLAARTLQRWHTDSSFLDSRGKPRALPFIGGDLSFAELVRRVGGDVPPGAVRDELVSGKSVNEDAEGNLRAIRRHFVPGDVSDDLVVNLTQLVHPVIEGLVRNTAGDASGGEFMQRIAYTDRMKESAVLPFRKLARERCEQFVEEIDDWISANEVPEEKGKAAERRVEVGVFYFEGLPAERLMPGRKG